MAACADVGELDADMTIEESPAVTTRRMRQSPRVRRRGASDFASRPAMAPMALEITMFLTVLMLFMVLAFRLSPRLFAG